MRKKTLYTIIDAEGNTIEAYGKFDTAFEKYVELVRNGEEVKFRHKIYFLNDIKRN